MRVPCPVPTRLMVWWSRSQRRNEKKSAIQSLTRIIPRTLQEQPVGASLDVGHMEGDVAELVRNDALAREPLVSARPPEHLQDGALGVLERDRR